jgi:hypothetical protein
MAPDNREGRPAGELDALEISVSTTTSSLADHSQKDSLSLAAILAGLAPPDRSRLLRRLGRCAVTLSCPSRVAPGERCPFHAPGAAAPRGKNAHRTAGMHTAQMVRERPYVPVARAR